MMNVEKVSCVNADSILLKNPIPLACFLAVLMACQASHVGNINMLIYSECALCLQFSASEKHYIFCQLHH